MICEFHVPISPTPSFLHRVHYLAASIEMFSGLRSSEYRLIVTVGDACRKDLPALCPWAKLYPLEWRWVDPDRFRQWSYFATGNDRLAYRFEADAVVLLDADVLVVGSLVDLIDDVRASGALHALQDHVSPFWPFLHIKTHREWWQAIYREAGLADPVFDVEHSGWGIIYPDLVATPDLRFGPFYPNYGVVAACPGILHAIGRSVVDELPVVDRVLDTKLRAQIALSLVVARKNIPWKLIPLKYNFPNMPEFFEKCAAAAWDARIYHYIQPFEVDKYRDFVTYGHVENMLEREGMHPVDQDLARRFRTVHFERVLDDLGAVGITQIDRPERDWWAAERKRDRARNHIDAGEWAEAHSLLTELIADLAEDPTTNYLLAYALHALGSDLQGAERCYRCALLYGFDEFWVRYNLGALLLRTGRPEEAAVELRRAASLNPFHEGARRLVAQLP